jgi:hypothetical protein
MAAAVPLSLVAFLKSGVGLSPAVAFTANVDVVQNTARASHDARRRRWARVGVLALLLGAAGIALALS